MAGDRKSWRPGTGGGLLDAADPPAVCVINPQGTSPFLLTGDHAGNRIPAALGTLGLAEADRARHIAWDIGVGALGEAMAALLDAVFVRQTFSRLVIDCNRDPASAEAVPERSDGTAIPGNIGLDEAARLARIAAIQEPYQQAIAAEIARRQRAGQATVLVALHSFTPVMGGADRPWHVGILHDGANDGFARAILTILQTDPATIVGDNEPYRMDATDHTVPRHAFAAGLPYVEIEVAQGELRNEAEVSRWAGRLAAACRTAALE